MDLRVQRTANKDPTWCSCHHTSNPEILQSLYEEYAKSGSQILSANTYSILQYLLRTNDNEILDSVARAVQIVKNVQASYPNITIAGCLSAHNCHEHADAEIKKSLRLLSSCLKHSSVDFILVEMVQNKRIGKIMVEAADESRLPLMIGFSVVRDGACLKLKKDDSLSISVLQTKVLRWIY